MVKVPLPALKAQLQSSTIQSAIASTSPTRFEEKFERLLAMVLHATMGLGLGLRLGIGLGLGLELVLGVGLGKEVRVGQKKHRKTRERVRVVKSFCTLNESNRLFPLRHRHDIVG